MTINGEFPDYGTIGIHRNRLESSQKKKGPEGNVRGNLSTGKCPTQRLAWYNGWLTESYRHRSVSATAGQAA